MSKIIESMKMIPESEGEILFVYVGSGVCICTPCDEVAIYKDDLIAIRSDTHRPETICRFETYNKYMLISGKWLPRKPYGMDLIRLNNSFPELLKFNEIHELTITRINQNRRCYL